MLVAALQPFSSIPTFTPIAQQVISKLVDQRPKMYQLWDSNNIIMYILFEIHDPPLTTGKCYSVIQPETQCLNGPTGGKSTHLQDCGEESGNVSKASRALLGSVCDCHCHHLSHYCQHHISDILTLSCSVSTQVSQSKTDPFFCLGLETPGLNSKITLGGFSKTQGSSLLPGILVF